MKLDTYDYLDPILSEELKDPAAIAKEAAANAVIVANSVANLGLPGQNNTQLSRDLYTANLSQIEQIQKLFNFPADLPFQTNGYVPPEMQQDLPESKAAVVEGEAVAEEGTANGDVAYELTKKSLDKSTAPTVFGLIGQSIGSIVGGWVSYGKTNVAGDAANRKAKAFYKSQNK